MNLSTLLPVASGTKKKKGKLKKKKKGLMTDLLLLNNNRVDSDSDIDELERELQEKKRLQIEAEDEQIPTTGIAAMLPAARKKKSNENKNDNIKKPHTFELREGISEACDKEKINESLGGGLSLGYSDSDSNSDSELKTVPEAISECIKSTTLINTIPAVYHEEVPDAPLPLITVQQLQQQQQQQGNAEVVETQKVIKKTTFTFKNRAEPKPREEVIVKREGLGEDDNQISTSTSTSCKTTVDYQEALTPLAESPPSCPPDVIHTPDVIHNPDVIHISQSDQLRSSQSYAPLVQPTSTQGKSKNSIFNIAAQAAAYKNRAEYNYKATRTRR